MRPTVTVFRQGPRYSIFSNPNFRECEGEGLCWVASRPLLPGEQMNMEAALKTYLLKGWLHKASAKV